jgi:hypothetical protein
MLRSCLFIIALEVVSFGTFVGDMGFYSDEWHYLELVSRANGYWSAVEAFFRTGNFWARPMCAIHFALGYFWGAHPVPYHIINLGLETLGGILFFVLLDRLLAWRSLALLAACLALIYPNHTATHHWASDAVQLYAIDLTLAALILHLAWRRSGCRSVWIGALLCYGLAMFFYESCAFLPLLLAVGLVAQDVTRGQPLRESVRAHAAEFFPLAGVLIAVLFWQWVAVRVFGGSNTKDFGGDPIHFLKTFRTGLAGITFKSLLMCVHALPAAIRDLAPWRWWALAAWSTLAAAYLRISRPESRDERGVLLTAFAMAAAAYVGAALPYALSRDYMPNMHGLDSRTSATIAMAGGLLAAASLAFLRCRIPALARFLTAILLASFTWTDWHAASQWALSWRLQKSVIRSAARKAVLLPPSSTVLLAGVPVFVNRELNPIPVFGATWDFSAALRLATRRPDIQADVISEHSVFYPDRVVREMSNSVQVYRKGLFVYHYDRDRVTPLNAAPPVPIPPGRFPGRQG